MSSSRPLPASSSFQPFSSLRLWVTLAALAFATKALATTTATFNFTTFAGSTVGAAGFGDGTGTAAFFNEPAGVAIDAAGNIFVSDAVNANIRKITPAGVVTTFAGSTARVAGRVDGTGTAARFEDPAGLAFDSAGNLFVADLGGANIRKITPAGVVTTFAGSTGGVRGRIDDTGTAARFEDPAGLAFDSAGNLFVADEIGNIREISPAGVVTTFAGSTAGLIGRIDATGTAARFEKPFGLAFDSSGILYVADPGGPNIRAISPDGTVTTFAGSTAGANGHIDGTGTAATFDSPTGVVFDSLGNLVVIDETDSIRRVTPAGVVTTIAGSTTGLQGRTDGIGTIARFHDPISAAFDSHGNLYVADILNRSVRIGAPVTLITQPVAITTQPVSTLEVTAGSTASFSVVATGTPSPTFQWQKDGTPITGATNSSLVLTNVQQAQAGSYTVVVTNTDPAGSLTSSPGVLSIDILPKITSQPVARSVNVGQSVSFSVAATGVPAPTFQWRKNGQPISNATDATLTLAETQPGDAGNYSVVATNNAGIATSQTVALTINVAATILDGQQPVGRSVNAGTTVSFSVGATGSPAPSFQWFRNGVAVGGGTQATLTLANVQVSQAGSYTVAVKNLVSTVTSSAATLVVGVAPTITKQPASSQTVNAGTNVTYTATVIGTPTPTLQWKKNGKAILGATSATLVLNNVQTGDAGSYTLVATSPLNNTQTTSVPTLLTVRFVAILKQPVSQAVTAGATVSFGFVPDGNPAPTYQWFRNGVAISKATGGTLTLTNVQVAQAGSYTVAVKNTAGTVTSSAAVLSVSVSRTLQTSLSKPGGTASTTAGAAAGSGSLPGQPSISASELTTQHFNDFIWNGVLLVAVGDGGVIYTSPNGADWTSRNSGTKDDLESITWDGRRFLTVGSKPGANSNDLFSFTSPDGITWTAQ